METVKDFRDAGLVFVEGDKAVDFDGDSLYGMHEKQTGPTFLFHYGPFNCVEFAWRKNTGERPSFGGDVEVEYRDGKTDVGIADCFGWSLEGDHLDIIKWIPVISKESKVEDFSFTGSNWDLINKPSMDITNKEKPTCTKEMHEAGEFKNGDKVQVPSQGAAVLTFIGASAKYKTCILEFDDGSTAYELPEFIRHADTRTDEEKLIDDLAEWMELADKTNSATYETKARATIAWLEAMGYRKP